MKKLLLALALAGCAASAARAEIYDGGTLIVRGSYPVGQSGRLEVASGVAEYSNLTTYQSFIHIQGPAAQIGNNRITRLLADDITPIGAHPGADVTSFTFSIVNQNGNAVTVRPLARFWFPDGAGGGPGHYYHTVGFNFAPVTVPGVTVMLYTALPGPGKFPMPGGTFWAGLAFDDGNGTTGATLGELQFMGQGGFYPPTVGSSADLDFSTNDAGSFFLVDFPFGGLGDAAYLGLNASWAWEFVVDNLVPVKTTTWGSLKALYR